MPRKKDEIVIQDSNYVTHSKEKAMKTVLAEGSLTSTAISMSSSYMTPFALAVGGNSFHVGLLSALSGLMTPLGHLRGSRLMEKYPRKRIILLSKLLHILLYIPMVLIIYLSWKGLLLNYLPYFLILVWAVLVSYIWAAGDVAWFSWLGDIVPSEQKGKYFSKKNRINGFVGLVTFIIAGFILDIFKTRGYVLAGFTLIFVISLVFRITARNLVKKIFNPKLVLKKGYYFSFKDFVKRFDNYGKFSFFQAGFYFSVMLSSPFFAVYMLDNLNFNYFTFTIVSMSSTAFYLLFNPLAGKFSDEYGNVKLMYVSGILFPIVPILWIFISSPILLILLPGLISGIANAAFIIAVTNFSYDSVSPQKRGLCFAYTSLLAGGGTLIGSLAGGFLIEYLQIDFMKPIFFVFLISSLLMIMNALFFLPQIKEERKTDRIQGLSVDWHHPFKMVRSDLVWFKNFIHGG